MTYLATDAVTRLRVLESWLPLAQEVQEAGGWRYDNPALEMLLVRALPSLLQACSTAEARAILQRVYTSEQDTSS